MKQGRELLVGTVVIAGIVVAVIGTLWLQGTNWGRPVTVVEVWVRDVGQLMRGNPVVYRGVPIGRVATIGVDTSGAFVRIGAELEGEVAIPDDGQGLVSPQSLFGDWQLEIVTRSRFPRFDYYEVPLRYHEDGIRVIGGYALPDISRLTAAADEISENLSVLTERFDRAFSDETADALAELVQNLRQLSDDVSELFEQQAVALDNVTEQVERAASEFGDAAAVGRQTLERIDDMLARGDIDSVVVNVQAVSRSMNELVLRVGESTEGMGTVLARADTTLQTITRIAANLEDGEGAIGRLLTDSTLALRAETAVLNLELLLQDIRENPGRYVRLSIF